jgi:FixJ family two-component response regulator
MPLQRRGSPYIPAKGRSNKDIARRLAITEGTAKTHVKAILTKLDAIWLLSHKSFHIVDR